MDLVAYVPRFPAPGETLFGSAFEMGFGGKGANQCVMAAKLSCTSEVTKPVGSPISAEVAMVAAVGDDAFGGQFIAELQRQGVDTDAVKVVPATSTGVAPIWVDEKGENSIVVVPGANLQLLPSDIAAAKEVLSRSSAVLCQLEVPQETTLAALQQARKAGVVAILTPAPAPPAPLDAEFYLNTDILVPNKVEALALAGMSANSGDITMDTLKTAAQNLLERGCRAVVMTLGSKGCLIAIQGEDSLTHVPAAHVAHVVDTTGAGDAFSGALAYFYAQLLPAGTTGIHGATLIEAARRAAFVAADSVTKKGTQKSYPSRAELPSDLFAHHVTSVALPIPARI